MLGLTWSDLAVVCVGLCLLALHFALSGLPSRFLSPWLISAVLVGWITGKIALHRIEHT